jgi:hypothetical protein
MKGRCAARACDHRHDPPQRKQFKLLRRSGLGGIGDHAASPIAARRILRNNSRFTAMLFDQQKAPNTFSGMLEPPFSLFSPSAVVGEKEGIVTGSVF